MGEPVSAGRALQERLGTRARAQRFEDEQVLDHLNPRMRSFIARREMMFVATSDARGACDNTLRAGPPGFVVTLDARRLAWPEYRGNGVLASRGNIAANPHVGLLFVDLVDDLIGLHVNGRAALVGDDELRAAHPGLPADPAPGRRAEQWVLAEVTEAYVHCSKHIPRLYRAAGEGRPGGSDYFGVAADRAAPTAAPAAPPWRSRLRRIVRWRDGARSGGRPAS
ncbi:pyridoxamine 5'-phosphate oxidase family protein [Spirilliplanes yamanashiensis]|uniref:Hydrolase n=1 Tax=Spirilliplanes yamanashiensis TaxID=42233 RepID=A0A8J3YAJ8_9ACTN|nr:pyridoxamine 5'-phosphate oxidase family protein [Spirilliplanes yamanashiensis]MDP9818142.1 putative pyridoxine 5'-phosphate oxidase superfamily flavin-nucleotide-binding protein [Spirilliplanes yamanashiensis]GIJ04953.1 hydrolase [Spirilliplanes yamanashiensis]